MPEKTNREPVHDSDICLRFGPLPTQVVPLDWAERMLLELRETKPQQFGKLLANAAVSGP